MLDTATQNQLKDVLYKITEPVELALSRDDQPLSAEVVQFLKEISTLSDKISVVQTTTVTERKPTFFIRKKGTNDTRMAVAGLPMGNIFSSFVLSLLQTGGVPMKLNPDIMSGVKAIQKPCHFITYTTYSCELSPQVIETLNMMTLLNPNISHIVIDGSSFMDEVDQKMIPAVPCTYLNNQDFSIGYATAETLFQKLERTLSDQSTTDNQDIEFVLFADESHTQDTSPVVADIQQGDWNYYRQWLQNCRDGKISPLEFHSTGLDEGRISIDRLIVSQVQRWAKFRYILVQKISDLYDVEKIRNTDTDLLGIWLKSNESLAYRNREEFKQVTHLNDDLHQCMSQIIALHQSEKFGEAINQTRTEFFPKLQTLQQHFIALLIGA